MYIVYVKIDLNGQECWVIKGFYDTLSKAQQATENMAEGEYEIGMSGGRVSRR